MNSSKYNIVFLRQANNDLKNIKQYLDKFDPKIFKSFYNKLKDKLYLLEFQPKIAGIFLCSNGNEYRRFMVNGYVVIYIFDESLETVFIYKIFHKSENYYQNLLNH